MPGATGEKRPHAKLILRMPLALYNALSLHGIRNISGYIRRAVANQLEQDRAVIDIPAFLPVRADRPARARMSLDRQRPAGGSETAARPSRGN